MTTRYATVVAAWVVTLVINMSCAPSGLDRYLQSQVEEMPATALAAGIMDSDGLVWEGHYGTIDGRQPTSENSLFMIASVSKLVIVTAAMQLWEQDAFLLDDDINDYLAFEVHNPSHPNTPITFRQLMTHHSSIADSDVYYDLYTIQEGGGDSPWPLGEYLQAYLVPGGELYTSDSYLAAAPGERYDYSNSGSALLAYLVEVISDVDYADYCRDNVFRPLGMDHTYYRLSDIPASEELVTCFDGDEPLPHYGYPDYPTGAVRTTIRDLSAFCSFYLDPAASDVAILEPETVARIFSQCDAEDRRCAPTDMALIWGYMDWLVPGAIGHTGGDFGVATSLLLYPDDGYGTLLFMNEEPPRTSTEQAINERLHEEGMRLLMAR